MTKVEAKHYSHANVDEAWLAQVREGSIKNLGQPTCLSWTDQPG